MGGEARNTSGVDLALAVWRRRKWLAGLILAASLSAAVSLVMSLPEIYRSTATVLVERHQVPESFVRSSVTGELDTRLHTVSQEILSRARLKDLIIRFDLYPNLRSNGMTLDTLTERMRRDIQLELKGVDQRGGRSATVAFTLSYLGRDSETVASVTNTLASFYVEENSKVRERQASGTAEFLKLQLETVKRRLDEQERRVREFKTRYLGELPQQVPANLATMTRLNEQLRQNGENQARAMERQAGLPRRGAEAESPHPTAAPDATVARIAKLHQDLLELRTRFTDKHPDVIRVRAEITALERQLAEAKPDGRPDGESVALGYPSLARLKEAASQAEAELRALRTEEQSLRREIAAYQRRVESAPQREQELQELSRDYESTRDLFQSLLKRYEDAELAESMEQRQKGELFRVLDPAIAARRPAAPNRVRLLMVGLMLSVGMAVGSVLLAERLETSFHSADALRNATQVPVLASIPRIVTPTDAGRRRGRFWLAAASAMLGVALIIGASSYVGRENEELVWNLTRALP